MAGAAALPTLVEFRENGGPAAVVLVHGFGGEAEETFGQLPEFLLEDSRLDGWDLFSLGYHTRIAPDISGIWSGDPSLSLLARYLVSRAATPPLDSYRALALVSHSMGGLIVQRALLDSTEFSRRISHVFMYGTPSGGLHKARLARLFKPQVTDMGAHSRFITTLRSDWAGKFAATRPFELFVIPGLLDQFVPPSSSSDPFPPEVVRPVPGNHLQIVKPESRKSENVQVIVGGLIGDAAAAGPWNSALVAVEKGDFQVAIEALLPNAHRLGDTHLVQLALALDSVGRRNDAIGVLEREGMGLDALGVLAGRLKRRWMVEGLNRDAREATNLYSDGYRKAKETENADQAYYHGINLAFMHLAYLEDARRAAEFADEALAHCASAAANHWRSATIGEANLYRGATDAAIAAYQLAVSMRPSPRQMASMYQQAAWIARLRDDFIAEAKLEEVFRPTVDIAP